VAVVAAMAVAAPATSEGPLTSEVEGENTRESSAGADGSMPSEISALTSEVEGENTRESSAGADDSMPSEISALTSEVEGENTRESSAGADGSMPSEISALTSEVEGGVSSARQVNESMPSLVELSSAFQVPPTSEVAALPQNRTGTETEDAMWL